MDQSDNRPAQEQPGQAASSGASSPADEGDADFLLPGRKEELRGSRLGDVRVRIVRPNHPEFRRVSRGVLEATEAAYTPQGRLGKGITLLKRVLIGVPIATARAEQERLTKFKALAVLSSDAISSVAYASEAILINLVAGGSGHLGLTLPISLVIIGLLCIVATSYRQTIPAYPNGGGSYIVAKENLGTLAGLIAAAALLIAQSDGFSTEGLLALPPWHRCGRRTTASARSTAALKLPVWAFQSRQASRLQRNSPIHRVMIKKGETSTTLNTWEGMLGEYSSV